MFYVPPQTHSFYYASERRRSSLTYTPAHDASKLQGKVAELKLELNSSGGKKDKNFLTKRIALKKIVANMTMSNNDMVALFPDIVGCMGIPNLEIKKM
jgi:vesicle coat complex subunit